MIPVQNIYYLLSYAWDKLTESDTLSTDIDDYEELVNLFAKVLLNGCTNLIKRGLHSDYIEFEHAYRGIKGKLLFAESIKGNHLRNGIAICSFDEFIHDTIPNRIIKSTLHKLYRTDSIHPSLKPLLVDMIRRFHEVTLMPLNVHIFDQVKLNRNNYHYHFILKICRIIFDNIVLNELSGKYEFQDFLRDRRMAGLFESFLYNFYQKNTNYLVKSESFHWHSEVVSKHALPLPKMNTDISLLSPDRKIIVDAKFYHEALLTNYNKETIRSTHLYQLYAYLKNEKSSDSFITEGMLIYPTVRKELHEDYIIDGHPVRIATINLNQEWHQIDNDLKQLVA